MSGSSRFEAPAAGARAVQAHLLRGQHGAPVGAPRLAQAAQVCQVQALHDEALKALDRALQGLVGGDEVHRRVEEALLSSSRSDGTLFGSLHLWARCSTDY